MTSFSIKNSVEYDTKISPLWPKGIFNTELHGYLSCDNHQILEKITSTHLDLQILLV